MARLESILTLVLVTGLLLAPSGASLFGVKSEAFENRALATIPEWDVSKSFDADTYGKLSTYLDDHLPLRKSAVTADAWLDLEVFGDSPHSRARLGLGEWLYFDDALRRACEDDAPIDDLLDRVQEVGEIVRASGRRFMYVLVPNKYTVHPEHASHRVHELARCSDEKKQELDARLAVRPVPGFYDLSGALRSLRDQYDQQLFFADDSHLNPLGSAVMARLLVDFVRPGLWSGEALRGPSPARRSGDLSRMVRLRPPVEYDQYAILRPGVSPLPTQSYPRKPGHPLRILRAQSDSVEMIEERVFLFHDSSMNVTLAMLRPYFADIASLDWNAFDAHDVAEQFAEAEVVIIEGVERGFYWRVHQQLGSDEFLRELRRALGGDG